MFNHSAFGATEFATTHHGALTGHPGAPQVGALLAVLLATTGWALWVRRDSWSSRWGAPLTASIAFQTFGAVLDTPLQTLQDGVSRFLGGPHVATLIADLSYLAAAFLAVLGVYTRLLPDHWATAVLNTRALQPLIAVAAVMIAAFTVSSAASTGPPLTHLYFIPRDGWLTLYWVVYCLSLQTLLVVFLYGVSRLDRRHVFARLYRVAVLCAVIASTLQLIGLIAHPPLLITLCWSLGYGCTILMSLAAARVAAAEFLNR